MLLLALEELGIGAVVGLAVGRLAVLAFREAQFCTTGLYPVASIAAAALAFGVADVLHGSGFISVYLAGADAWAARRSPAGARSRTSTTAWPGSARSRCS